MTYRIYFPGLTPTRTPNILCQALQSPLLASSQGATPQPEGSVHQIQRLFAMSGPEDANVWVYPYNFAKEVAGPIAAEARQLGKPLLFLYDHDDTAPTCLEWGTVYRTSAYASTMAPHERIMPAPCKDPLLLGLPPERAYDTVPTVGFCGFVGRLPMLTVYKLLGRHEKAIGLKLRRQSLSILNRTPALRTDFITRTQFWAGALDVNSHRRRKLVAKIKSTLTGKAIPEVRSNFDASRRDQVYREFVTNILGSDYVLAVRGAGNFSYRFYQTLASGRVPVLIDTDTRLPFSDAIDWAKHVVIVPLDDLRSIGSRIVQFHHSLNKDKFAALKAANRRIWEDYCCDVSFYRNAITRAVQEA